MVDVKVVIPEDMGSGLTFNPNTQKFEAISQIAFTEREATVDLMINGIQLLFREVANSNRTMIATGVRYNNVWYGDSPDDTPAQNPFSGQPITALQPLTNDSFATKADLVEFAKKSDLSSYVQKGQNGSWGDTIPVSSDLHIPQRLVAYDSSTNNKPFNSRYGTAISFSSNGNLTKARQNWISTLAFGTDQRIFYTQSINAGQDNWVAIPTATFSEHTVNFSSTMPAAGASTVVNVPTDVVVHRHKLTNLRMRVDLPNNSIMFQGKLEAIIDSRSNITGIKFTNDSAFNIPSGRPLTIFMSYER